jgi:hypothetical protein
MFWIGARTRVSGVRLVVRRQEFRCAPQYNNWRKTNHLILLALPGAPEFNLSLLGVRIAQFIVFCRSSFVFFLLSIVFSVFNLCLLITTLVCQIFLMIISTHFNNMFSKWFLYVFAHLKPNDFIPIHSCRGHMDDEHMKFLYSFFLWEVQHFYLTCKHVTLSNHEALIYTGTNTWGWVVYLIYPANPLDK